MPGIVYKTLRDLAPDMSDEDIQRIFPGIRRNIVDIAASHSYCEYLHVNVVDPTASPDDMEKLTREAFRLYRKSLHV
jgi:hypothetical protein